MINILNYIKIVNCLIFHSFQSVMVQTTIWGYYAFSCCFLKIWVFDGIQHKILIYSNINY